MVTVNPVNFNYVSWVRRERQEPIESLLEMLTPPQMLTDKFGTVVRVCHGHLATIDVKRNIPVASIFVVASSIVIESCLASRSTSTKNNSLGRIYSMPNIYTDLNAGSLSIKHPQNSLGLGISYETN